MADIVFYGRLLLNSSLF